MEIYLLSSTELHNLLITYTIFKHKPSHQITWISPLAPTFLCKNPYQNQIDCILFESRSFNSNLTRFDHKPVTAKIQIKWT